MVTKHTNYFSITTVWNTGEAGDIHSVWFLLNKNTVSEKHT